MGTITATRGLLSYVGSENWDHGRSDIPSFSEGRQRYTGQKITKKKKAKKKKERFSKNP